MNCPSSKANSPRISDPDLALCENTVLFLVCLPPRRDCGFSERPAMSFLHPQRSSSPHQLVSPPGCQLPRNQSVWVGLHSHRPPRRQGALWTLCLGSRGSWDVSRLPHARDGLRGGAAGGGCGLCGSQAPTAAAEGPRRDPLHQPPYRWAHRPGSNRSGV